MPQFKIKRVAELLGTRKANIYRMVKNKQLKLSGTKPYRISIKELRKYMLNEYPTKVLFILDLFSHPDRKLGKTF